MSEAPDTNSSPKDLWDKADICAKWLAGILIPVSIAFVGNHVAGEIKRSELEVKYIEIATSLIRDSPRAENVALRSWAVDVLAKNAKRCRYHQKHKRTSKGSAFRFTRVALPTPMHLRNKRKRNRCVI